MNIALLNEKITIQKAFCSVDDYGNHVNTWEDYFTCHATVSGESGNETTQTGVTEDQPSAAFTVRWCSNTAAIEPTGYRVVMGDEIYNITSIDHQNFKRKSLKLWGRKVRR